jgi:uncharacterized protein
VSAYLLDINVLLALSDPMHLHHEAAHRWLAAHSQAPWATCPLTENGFVRIASHPSYPNRPGNAQVVLALLRRLCVRDGHTFWPDDVSLRALIQPTALLTHNQLTDVYLLGLAIAHGGKLASFDQHIPVAAITGGAQALELIRA